MTARVMIGLLTLSILSVSADTATFSVATEGSFASLDDALNHTAGLKDVVLELLPTQPSFTVSATVVLSQRLWVHGQGQSLQLGATLYVKESGLVTISNVTLVHWFSGMAQAGVDALSAFVRLENCANWFADNWATRKSADCLAAICLLLWNWAVSFLDDF